MKSKVPGFNGERLRQARRVQGLTLDTLAQSLGLSKQTISHYERGDTSPRPKIFQRICELLNFPSAFFLKPLPDMGEGPIFWRKFSRATKLSREISTDKFIWAHEISHYLKMFIRFPDVDIPEFSLPSNPTKITNKDIEKIALEVRRYWGLGKGPLPNIINTLESKGVLVLRAELGDNRLDAFSQWWSDGAPAIFLSSDKEAAVRSRFDASHELGHLILHRNTSDSVHDEFHALREKQAHRFASAFLMPSDTFLSEFSRPNLDAFWAIKERWKVAIAAMIYRCKDLNIIDEKKSTHLWKLYAQRGWRRGEPGDDYLSPERPIYLQKCFDLLIDSGTLTKEAIISELAFPPRWIEEIASLPNGFFPRNEKVVHIKPSLRNELSSKKNATKATVIDIKKHK